MSEEILCNYFGCEETIADDEKNSTDQMKFCKTHQSEINNLVISGDVPGIIKFWVKAQGGAKKAAERTLGHEVEDDSHD